VDRRQGAVQAHGQTQFLERHVGLLAQPLTHPPTMGVDHHGLAKPDVSRASTLLEELLHPAP